jgi:hypothetical protein
MRTAGLVTAVALGIGAVILLLSKRNAARPTAPQITLPGADGISPTPPTVTPPATTPGASPPAQSETLPPTLEQQWISVLDDLGYENGQFTFAPSDFVIDQARALAAILEQQGYPEHAADLRDIVEAAILMAGGTTSQVAGCCCTPEA